MAREHDAALYLAGGGVRDLLLDRPVRDVDLVVEGDVVPIARALAARLGGAIREHRRFGTAAITLRGGERIDIASTRRETYAHPGALPAVVLGASIEEDLARRDFTVNAMALGLSPLPRRVDPFGGGDDLARGVIRALHARSFLDDPTRAFRAVRYANRLGFRIHTATRREIAEPAAHQALSAVSGDRERRELQLMFEEPSRGRAVTQMSALGIARAVEPSLGEDPRAAARVARAESLKTAFAGETTWLCYLLAWMWNAGQRQAQRLADRLAVVGAEGRTLRSWPERAKRLTAGTVPEDASTDELVAAAAGLAARARRMLLARAAARQIRLAIRGADLVAAGIVAGPAVGAALARTLVERRAGRIREQDELAFALAAAKEDQP